MFYSLNFLKNIFLLFGITPDEECIPLLDSVIHILSFTHPNVDDFVKSVDRYKVIMEKMSKKETAHFLGGFCNYLPPDPEIPKDHDIFESRPQTERDFYLRQLWDLQP